MDIRNKVTIVTGASSGIGLATARLLNSAGAKVAIVARSKDELQKTANELTDSFVAPADMAKPDQIITMVKSVQKHFGAVDILVNNAGRGYDAPLARAKLHNLQRIFDLDFVGPLVAMQQVIPFMKAQGGGSIINISSGTALMHLPNMGIYAAIKAALAHMSLTAREELKGQNINVSVIYPYITQTDFEKNTIREVLEDDQAESPGSYEPPQADTAEFVAGLIVNCIKNGEAEVVAHEWMKRSTER